MQYVVFSSGGGGGGGVSPEGIFSWGDFVLKEILSGGFCPRTIIEINDRIGKILKFSYFW